MENVSLLLENLSSELYIYCDKDKFLSVLRSEYSVETVYGSYEKIHIESIDRAELLNQLEQLYGKPKRTEQKPELKPEPKIAPKLSPEVIMYRKFAVEDKGIVVPEDADSLIDFLDYVSAGESFNELNGFIDDSQRNFRYMSTYSKKMTQYVSDIERLKIEVEEKLSEDSTSNLQYYPARETAGKILGKLESYLLNGIIRSVRSRLANPDEDAESKKQLELLLEKFNRYVSSIGIYTYQNAEPDKFMDDDDYDYYEVDSISVSDERLIGMIKSVIVPSYIMSFEIKGRTDFTYTMGSALVYSE